MLKNKSFILTVILPIFISILVGIVIITLNSRAVLNTRASAVVAAEKNDMNSNMSSMKKEKSKLSKKAADYDKTLADNKLLSDEITALTGELADYNESIKNAKHTIAELESAIADKTAYKQNLGSLSDGKTGEKKTYTNKTLAVPLDLSAGRYIAEGKGTLMIYTGTKLVDKAHNLSLIDTNSYTFDIKSGQSVKIEGTLSLTKILE